VTPKAMAQFFAILSLVVWAATFIVIVLAVLYRRNPESNAGYFFEDIRRNAIWIACAVAFGTMLGSLYLSEVAHYQPCPLCWYQRICMYPLGVLLLVGGIRRDRMVWTYILPPAIIGTGFAIYHTQLQAFPEQAHPFCKLDDPCTIRFVWEFGFVSIPFMALAAFSFIITMMLVLRSERVYDDLDDDDALDEPEPPVLSVQGAS
jgi:disulfide bond formation protein DsbB